MHDCLTRLLRGKNGTDEENLECLCNLMKTIGKDLDHQKSKVTIHYYTVGRSTPQSLTHFYILKKDWNITSGDKP